MPWNMFRSGQSALAILIILFIAGTRSSQNIQPIRTYVPHAFWCSVIETAVWCPAKVITYFTHRNRRIPPRVRQRVDQFISFLWCEMTVCIVAQSVQPFIIHASLTPYLKEVSTSTSAPKPNPWGTLDQGVVLFCVFQIFYSVTLCARTFQSDFEYRASLDFPNVDPKDVPITPFHVLTAVQGCVCHLLGTAGLYIERIATGTLVTSLAIAHRNLDGPRYWAFTAAAGALMMAAYAYMWWLALEWDDQEDWLMVNQGRWRPVRQKTMVGEMMDRLCLRLIWVLEACFQRMVPWRLPRLGRWYCPELAALWPEAELHQFYVELQAGLPPLARLAPWSNSIRHVVQWRTAGLTRDYATRDYSTGPALGPTGWLGQLCYVVLGRVLMVLVWFLRAAFAWFFSLALVITGNMWNEERKVKLKLKRN